MNFLTSDFEFGQGRQDWAPGSDAKFAISQMLFEEWEHHEDPLGDRAWEAVLRDCDHSREKVRAGSLLLLYRCPDRERARERARAALRDSSSLVRLAAAGTLALEGRFSGEPELLEGLAHERWEVRYWCGVALTASGETRYVPQVRARAAVEPDAWVKQQLEGLDPSRPHPFPSRW